ncbi:hypothetical protein DH86_00001556 [Scytalidium sp. 3C]|nr:hypothetical protein DH86_00001556 [Scytalidium sp. 3C]
MEHYLPPPHPLGQLVFKFLKNVFYAMDYYSGLTHFIKTDVLVELFSDVYAKHSLLERSPSSCTTLLRPFRLKQPNLALPQVVLLCSWSGTVLCFKYSLIHHIGIDGGWI